MRGRSKQPAESAPSRSQGGRGTTARGGGARRLPASTGAGLWFKELYENLRDGFAAVDMTGRIVEFNQTFLSLVGYDAEELRELTYRDLTPERWHAIEAKILESQVLTRGYSDLYEKEYVRNDGSVIPVELRTYLQRDCKGRPLGMWAFVRDIRQRRRAEEDLRASQEYLTKVMDSAADAIFTVRMPDRVIEFASRAVRDVFGYEPKELLGRSTRLLYRDDAGFDEFARQLGAALARGETRLRVEHELVRKDGEPIWTELLTTCLFSDGALARTISVIRDMTQRRRTEEALRRSEETKRAILAALPDLTFLIGRDGVFRDFLSGAVEALYVPTESFLGRSVWEVLPPDLAALTVAKIETCLRENQVQAYEYTLPIQGEELCYEARMAALESDAVLVVVRDVTERRRFEEQLRQAQKMEAIGNLAGGAAHDFNNLLQSLLSNLQLLGASRAGTVRLEQVVEELEQQIRRGAALTRQLLLFARRETPRSELLDLSEVVTACAEMLRRLVRENIAFTLELSSEALPVEADRSQLEQVLVNLVLNARDAMPEGGGLTVRTGSDGEGVAWLTVEDTGCGIPAEWHQRIFEPFFTTKGLEGGTGLGLAVVHGIVSRHGGHMELTSEVGRGSALRVVLPQARRAAPRRQERTTAASRELPSGDGARVLLVEDESATRQALTATLAMLGYRATAVATGEAVLALPIDPAFDIMLTDLMLPDANGADLAALAGVRWPGMRVILMSGYTASEAVRRAVESGGVRYLQKPFDIESLARELGACRDESRKREARSD